MAQLSRCRLVGQGQTIASVEPKREELLAELFGGNAVENAHRGRGAQREPRRIQPMRSDVRERAFDERNEPLGGLRHLGRAPVRRSTLRRSGHGLPASVSSSSSLHQHTSLLEEHRARRMPLERFPPDALGENRGAA